MANIGNLRLDDFGMSGASVEEKLVDLVGADIAEDAAVLIRVPEPFRPARAAASIAMTLDDLVGCDVDGLDDFADGALLNEVASVNGGLDL